MPLWFIPPSVGRFLIDAPRWLFLATLTSVPLLYGSTRGWAVNFLLVQLYGVGLLWAAGYCYARRIPRVHVGLLVPSAFLVVQAWWMTLNAKFVCDVDTFEFQPLNALVGWAPGSIDRDGSLQASLLVTALCIASAFVCDLARLSHWRRRLLYTMAASGALMAALGLLQRVTQARGIFWQDENIEPTFFAAFRNYDNAAAFINLAWPLLAILLVAALRDGRRTAERLAISAGVALSLCAIFVTRSRAGSAIAVLLAVAILIWLVRQVLRREIQRVRRSELFIGIGLFVIVIGALAVVTGLEASLKRWTGLHGELTEENYRWLAYKVCLSMVPKAGWLGFGPGTFQCAFPYYTHEVGDAIRGRWTFAHEDYLQTIIEWGYIGAAAFGVYVLGSVIVALKRFLVERRALSFTPKSQLLAISLGLSGVLLHALVDFPLQIASIQFYAAVFVGLMWAAPQWLRKGNAKHRLI